MKKKKEKEKERKGRGGKEENGKEQRSEERRRRGHQQSNQDPDIDTDEGTTERRNGEPRKRCLANVVVSIFFPRQRRSH